LGLGVGPPPALRNGGWALPPTPPPIAGPRGAPPPPAPERKQKSAGWGPGGENGPPGPSEGIQPLGTVSALFLTPNEGPGVPPGQKGLFFPPPPPPPRPRSPLAPPKTPEMGGRRGGGPDPLKKGPSAKMGVEKFGSPAPKLWETVQILGLSETVQKSEGPWAPPPGPEPGRPPPSPLQGKNCKFGPCLKKISASCPPRAPPPLRKKLGLWVFFSPLAPRPHPNPFFQFPPPGNPGPYFPCSPGLFFPPPKPHHPRPPPGPEFEKRPAIIGPPLSHPVVGFWFFNGPLGFFGGGPPIV